MPKATHGFGPGDASGSAACPTPGVRCVGRRTALAALAPLAVGRRAGAADQQAGGREVMILTIEEHARLAGGALGRTSIDPRVLEAMRRVPRHAFVPAELAANAYEDRPLPIGHADTGRIVASALTDHNADDGSQLGPLLDRVDGPVASVTADGAFDRDDVYAEVAARHPDAAVVVPPRSGAIPSATAGTAPTRRDRHIEAIAAHGRMGWQKASGYNRRALVEADVSRWKRVIGDGLRSQTGGRQATEVAIAAGVLNRMLDLGRPEYVRIA